MDDQIKNAALQAAAGAKDHINGNIIPLDKDGSVRLGMREVMRKLIESTDITVVWDTAHSNTAVSSGILTAQDALIESLGRKGKKMYGVELGKQEYGSFYAYMKTGDEDLLPEGMKKILEGIERVNGRKPDFPDYERLRRGQYLQGNKTQEIAYVPYDDRSQLRDSDLREVSPERKRIVVDDRNVKMRDNIHEHLSTHLYDKIVIGVGSGHVDQKPTDNNPQGDLDEMLARDEANGKSYRIKSMAITQYPEAAPGIYKDKQVEYYDLVGGKIPMNADIERKKKPYTVPGGKYAPSDDTPDIWINNLPNTTPEQFDARVQTLTLRTRQGIVKKLLPWQKKYDAPRDYIQEHIDNRKALEGFSTPSIDFNRDFHRMVDSMNSWDFETAAKQLANIQTKHGDLKFLREEKEQELLLQGDVPKEKAVSQAYFHMRLHVNALDETTKLLDSIKADIMRDKEAQLAPKAMPTRINGQTSGR